MLAAERRALASNTNLPNSSGITVGVHEVSLELLTCVELVAEAWSVAVFPRAGDKRGDAETGVSGLGGMTRPPGRQL